MLIVVLFLLFFSIKLVSCCGTMFGGTTIYYSFDNVNDAFVEKISGGKRAFASVGSLSTAQFVAHDNGRALSIDSSGRNQIVAPHQAALEVGNFQSISYMLWFNARSLSKSSYIFLKDYQYGVSLNTQGRVRVYNGFYSGTLFQLSQTFSVNEWHHVAVVDAGQNKQIQVYLDGVLALNRPSIANRDSRSKNFEFGSFTGFQQYFDGHLDEIIVTNQQISRNSVQMCYSMVRF